MHDHKARLLVVDDDSQICRNLSIIFTALGYSVRVAPNGFSALDAIKQEIPDIILSDLNMPEMSGFELLSVIRLRFPTVRVIAMSGAVSGKEIPWGVAADAFYGKGTGLGFLLRTVEAMSQSQRSLAARSPRSAVPIWVRTNGHHPSGEPYVMIPCPRCLRTFPQVPDMSAAPPLNTKCVHCSHPIEYAIVRPFDYVTPAAALSREPVAPKHREDRLIP